MGRALFRFCSTLITSVSLVSWYALFLVSPHQADLSQGVFGVHDVRYHGVNFLDSYALVLG